MTRITIALSKGRIFDDTAPLLKGAGIVALDDPDTSRKLILATNRDNVRLIIVRASDVPTYVQYGAADLGIAGKDVLLEHGGAGLYQPLDLNIACCRMMVAVRDDLITNPPSAGGQEYVLRPSTCKRRANTLPKKACMWI